MLVKDWLCVSSPPVTVAYRPSAVTATTFGRAGAPSGRLSGIRATSAPGLPASARSRSTIDTLLVAVLGTMISFPSGVQATQNGRAGSLARSVPTSTREIVSQARNLDRPIPRFGKSLRVVAAHSALPYCRSHYRGLHRARHIVRELHPSDYDPLDFAICRRRGVHCSHAPPLRFFADRADRADPPGRHRQEERDHDDRFCRGRGTRPGVDPGAVNLRSMSDAVPAHYD